ncbi:MAG: hypothetical protein A3J27_12150 [Candidatus Tectomicrobia bacterium RIFCSPLOWO2_12_FULL_69_37]|nr:MAG: hypothetical protein A3J27_12150 [Candidatus Tectomicrobia bacterium RIFCSPLOWO2_12_FULL_69_37]
MSHRFLYQNMIGAGTVITPSSVSKAIVGGAVPRVANGAGAVIFSGAYTGQDQEVYTAEIETQGQVGSATFKWRKTSTPPGAWEASGLPTALTDTALDHGVKARFLNGASSPAFQAGDRWQATASQFRSPKMLHDLDPNTRWRSGSPPLGAEALAFDLGAAQAPDAAVILGHNISSGAAVKLQAGPDPQAYALLLDGSNSRAVTTDAAAIQNIWDGGGSVFFRTKLMTAGESNLGCFFGKGALSGLAKGWGFNQGTQFGTFRPSFHCIFTGGEARHLGPDAMFTAGVAASVGLSYNSDNPNNVPAIYKDGASQSISSFGAPTGTRVSDAGTNLATGDRVDGITSLDGWMDEVKFYNRVLTAQEFLGLHNGILPSDHAASCVLHLKFDEGTGTSAADSSASGLSTALQDSAAWTSSIYSPLDETITWRAGMMSRYLSTAPRSHRYWRLLIEGDGANPAGYVEIAELYLGGYFEPAYGFAWRNVVAEEALERGQETENGSVRSVLLNRGRRAVLPYAHVSAGQKGLFLSMFQAVKDKGAERNKPLFAHLDVNDAGSLFLATLAGTFSPAEEGPDDYAFELELQERLT